MKFKVLALAFLASISLSLSVIVGASRASKSSEYACGLTQLNTNFIYKELSEVTEVGETLLLYNVTGIQGGFDIIGCDAPVNYYFEIIFNQRSSQLAIRLNHSLLDHFDSCWSSGFETKLGAVCAHGSEEFELTLVTVVNDVNNRAPIFSIPLDPPAPSNAYKLNVTLPWPAGRALNPARAIQILDKDFEVSNANLTLSCENVLNDDDDACSWVSLSLEKIAILNNTPLCDSPCRPNWLEGVPQELGHRFAVDIFFVKDVRERSGKSWTKELSFYIVASDGVHVTRQLVDVLATPEVEMEQKFPLPVALGGGAGVLLVVSIISGFLFVYVGKNKRNREILRKLTEEEINDFRQGAKLPRGSVDLNAVIAQNPFRKDYEIPREHLKINEMCILGSGAFGIVYKGSVLLVSGMTEVAVKMLKPNLNVQYFKALMDELKILAFIGVHPNVLRLVGSCSKNIKKLELYIAVEYCKHGNIRDFLKSRKTSFSNMVFGGMLNPPSYISTLSKRHSTVFEHTVTTMDLIGWAQQVASGMEFLCSKHVIHGDLAARNILINSDRIAKISDFGLSRRLIDCTNYSKASKTPLPLRWMAPESLKFKHFSPKTDVWSYGIFLWEIFTLGQTPYAGVPNDAKFVDKIDEGLRMARPEYASDDIFEIMTKCWDKFDYNRPNFFEIKETMQGMLGKYSAESGEGYLILRGGSLGSSYSYSREHGRLIRPSRRTMTSVLDVFAEDGAAEEAATAEDVETPKSVEPPPGRIPVQRPQFQIHNEHILY